MADFAPPSGPPPPKVPEGWVAQWNDQYKEWFYVNKYTKKSQWDRPTSPIYPPPDSDLAPPGPPPSYNHGDAKPLGPEKTGLSSNNPYAHSGGGSSHDITEDERLARQLQAEEDARSGRPSNSRGASDSYYNQGHGGPSPQPQYGQQDLPPRPDQDRGSGKKGGFLGKLLGKATGGSSSSKPQYGGYPQQGGYPPQQQYYGGPPQGHYGYAPQQGYYGQGGGYGPPGGGYMQQPQRKQGGGLGAGGAAALGVGGGLVGGMLLADAMEDHDDHEYDQGYQDGQDNDMGGGGDDFGGGDF